MENLATILPFSMTLWHLAKAPLIQATSSTLHFRLGLKFLNFFCNALASLAFCLRILAMSVALLVGLDFFVFFDFFGGLPPASLKRL